MTEQRKNYGQEELMMKLSDSSDSEELKGGDRDAASVKHYHPCWRFERKKF